MADILGRRAEREVVEHLLARARSGHSGALVVRGEAGIGKTALLELARDSAATSQFRVEQSVGAEAESQFAFAGLHQLCAPLLDRVGALPEPQQAALGVAFGQRAGAAPDPFLVGLATLHLLAEVAEEAPFLCLVDDAQWLDEASVQVLAFVARRLGAEHLAMVFAVRDSVDRGGETFAGLPELRLTGLSESDARTLLATAVRAPLDERVRDRIVAETRGNPLALLELPRGAQTAELAGGFELPDALGILRRVEDAFQSRSGTLPAETQLLLLVAAADPTGDVALLWRAVAHLGVAREAAAPAEGAGLLEIDSRVRFCHPLARSALYQAAMPPDRRSAHGALAAVTDQEVDPDRRAWHRAKAVLGTDEEAAAELEQSADRARARGGLAAAAAFLQYAAELTPDPAARATRALEAAHAKHDAGASEVALELLAVAVTGPLDALQRARLTLLRARIEAHLTRGSEVPRMLLEAAKALGPLDAALSRETYLHALEAAIITGGHGVQEVAEAALDAPRPPEPPRPADLLLDGLVTTQIQGYEAGVPEVRRALEAFRPEPSADARRGSDSLRWLWLTHRTATTLFEDDLAYVFVDRHVRLARESGALSALPVALLNQSMTMVFTGKFALADELATEGVTIAHAIGAVPLTHAQHLLAGWRGRPHEVAELQAAIDRGATGRAHDTEVSMAQYALAVFHNALGNYPAAQAAAAQACLSAELSHSTVALPELVEAAARGGQAERASDALEELSSRARATGTPWALGLAARSRALVSDGRTAEEHYREALEQLGRCRVAAHLARTHLVYGEWLRREGRRQDARDQLRPAHDLLSQMGAEAFAERAARELRATGEHPRKRTAQPADALTAHELHISRLVATGATSREVGAQLFLSPRTIEAHLRSIFRKLGITSRRQLAKMQLP